MDPKSRYYIPDSTWLVTYYAIWSSSGSITITLNLNSETHWVATAFGISNVNTASPFDGSAGEWTNKGSTSGSGGTASVTGVSTSNANDFIIGALGVSSTPTASVVSPFELITAGSASRVASDEYETVSAKQSGLSVSYSLGSSSSNWGMVVDAVEEAQVTQPITVTMSDSAPSATVTITGGNPSPSTFPANGVAKDITMTAGASFTLSFSNSGSTRDGFIVSSAFSATSSSYTASTTAISVTAYEQVQNTFSATFNDGSPSSSDSLVLTGTYLGTTGSTVTTLSSTNSWSASAWSDYGTAVTFPASTTLSTLVSVGLLAVLPLRRL